MSQRPWFDGERAICIIPKNSQHEVRVSVKTEHKVSGQIEWIDIRQMWYSRGPTEEPQHTSKGTMFARKHVPKVLRALIDELKAEELEEHIGELIAKLQAKRA
jgi:hypothetical protein